MNTVFLLIVTFLAVFLGAWFDVFRDFLGAQINLLPALVVYASLARGIGSTALVAVCGGLWFDSLSLNPLGISVLPLFLIGFLIYINHDVLLRQNAFAQMMLGLAASLVYPLLTVFLLLSFGRTPLLGWVSIWELAVMVGGGAVLTPVIFLLFAYLDRTFNYQPASQSSFRSDRQIIRSRRN